MDRVVVVGPPGAGKTTLARRLASRLGCPHVEIDSLWWEPNWTEAGGDVLRERLRAVANEDRWVADGNYFSVGAHEVLWPRADTLIWLDQPRWVTVPRTLRRSMWRSLTRQALWSGNREAFSRLLRPDGIVAFAWREHPKYNRRYEGLDRSPDCAHLQWVRLRRPGAVRRWLNAVRM